jgi:hypothetical protein
VASVRPPQAGMSVLNGALLCTQESFLTAIGGLKDQTVTDAIVQEIDIRTGKVLFQWNSAGHVPDGDSHLPLPGKASEASDWFHINAAHLDPAGI